MSDPITQDIIDCWRTNYNLKDREPSDAASWWATHHNGAPAMAVAALGTALQEIERLTAERDAALADAERYRWLRQRLKVREERSMAGSYRDSIYIRVGQSFFDTPTRGDKGYLDKTLYEKECREFDAAIDAAKEKI